MFIRQSILLLLCSTLISAAVHADVNVYSARKEALIKPLLVKFTEKTGIKVNLVTGKADTLIKRLEHEGKFSPADLIITTDAGRLFRAKSKQLVQPMQSDILDALSPESYRDPEHSWYGLSVRARPIIYHKDHVKPEQLSTYEDLANPKWKQKICIRSSNNIYNQSMLASMIAASSAEQTEQWAKGFVKNFARPPKGGDRDQVKAVAAGLCDIAIVNTYYLAQMQHSKDKMQTLAANKVAIFWPNQNDRGSHVNISGAAITTSSKHPKEALKLLEYLAGDDAQSWYANTNQEYPIRNNIKASDILTSWGTFKADQLNLSELGKRNADAVKIMDRAGWR